MSDNEWQQMTASSTTNGNEWQGVVQRVTKSDTTSDNEWQQVTTNDNKWQPVVQLMTTSDTTNESKWNRMRLILGFRMKLLCNVQLQYIQQRLFENVT